MHRRLLVLLFLCSINHLLADNVTRGEAGVYFRLNQKAVDYIGDLASDAMPQILRELRLPDIDAGMASLSKIIIERFEKPSIRVKFVEGSGVTARVQLPDVRISAEASIFLFGDEKFAIEMNDIVIDMDVHFGRNQTTDRNVITLPKCNVTAVVFRGVFSAGSLLSGYEKMLRSKTLDGLREAICVTTLEAIQFVDEQEVPLGTVNVTVTTTSTPPTKDGSAFATAEFASSLCAVDRADGGPTADSESSEEVAVTSSTETLPGQWGVDLTLVYPPKFGKDEVIFGIDGGVLHDGVAARNVSKPHTLSTSHLNEKMIGIMLSEYIPNTLFAHIFDDGLGNYTERFYADNLPKVLRSMAKLFCGKCYLEVNAELSEKPRMEVDARLGARVALAGNVTVLFQGRKKLYDLLRANVTFHVTLKPSIRHSRLYGDVSLTNVDVNVKEMGMGGMLAAPLEKIVSFLVPRALWPQVKKRLRFALNKRGIKLPVLCGVELENLSLDYVDHAAVLNSDFTFDIPRFVRKFKEYLYWKQVNKKDKRHTQLSYI